MDLGGSSPREMEHGRRKMVERVDSDSWMDGSRFILVSAVRCKIGVAVDRQCVGRFDRNAPGARNFCI